MRLGKNISEVIFFATLKEKAPSPTGNGAFSMDDEHFLGLSGDEPKLEVQSFFMSSFMAVRIMPTSNEAFNPKQVKRLYWRRLFVLSCA
jgi:hypothetical protein